MLLKGDAAIGEQRGGIPGGLAGIGIGLGGVADQDGQGRFLREASHRFAIALEKGGTFEQVLRKIATDGEFGKDGQISAAAGRFLGHLEDAGRIAGEVADGGVELAEGDLHG